MQCYEISQNVNMFRLSSKQLRANAYQLTELQKLVSAKSGRFPKSGWEWGSKVFTSSVSEAAGFWPHPHQRQNRLRFSWSGEKTCQHRSKWFDTKGVIPWKDSAAKMLTNYSKEIRRSFQNMLIY